MIRRSVRLAGAALAGAAATAVAGALTRWIGPPAGVTWQRTNYRGRTVTLTGGWSAAVGSVGAAALCAPRGWRTAVLVAGTSAAAAGAYDDLLAPAVELRADKGWRGHVRAARAGRLSGGVVKVAGIGAGALLAGRLVSDSWRAALLRAAIVAGAANLANLFDLRPGRAAKVVAIAAGLQLRGPGAVIAAATGGAALAALPADLAETRMLGDLGANTLGALLGLALGARGEPVRWTALGVITALTVVSERVSFSRVIAATPGLRVVDQWGRRGAGPQ